MCVLRVLSQEIFNILDVMFVCVVRAKVNTRSYIIQNYSVQFQHPVCNSFFPICRSTLCAMFRQMCGTLHTSNHFSITVQNIIVLSTIRCQDLIRGPIDCPLCNTPLSYFNLLLMSNHSCKIDAIFIQTEIKCQKDLISCVLMTDFCVQLIDQDNVQRSLRLTNRITVK